MFDDEDEFSSFDSDSESESEPEAEVVEEKCTGNGIYHLGPCQFGAPLAVTWPHFLYAQPAITNSVTGLNPDEEKHKFYMVFQPEMGIGMRAYVRLQFNLKMEKSKAFTQLSRLPFESNETVIVPVMWFEDAIEAPPETLQILLADALGAGPNMAINCAIFAFISLILQMAMYISYVFWTYHSTDTAAQ